MTRWQMFTEWLAEVRQARRDRGAVARAAEAFSHLYPDWHGALFDLVFLRRFEPRELLEMEPGQLAIEWSRQLSFSEPRRRERHIARAAVAAANFQYLLATELRRLEELEARSRRGSVVPARRVLGQR